jgi:exopolyphosphatase/guanosine-5'-triphosphate,3'-diphosphate pyrophosphatase
MSLDRVAVIDIGSNSGRILVARIDEFGHLDVLETEGTPLRLVHELASSASLGDAVVERTVEALQGFNAIARGAGAQRTLAVATAAVREAINGETFVERLRVATGLDIQIISGETEARYGFLGGAYGTPTDDGILVDIGGGSIQLARYVNRCMVGSWSLPLGALRLSDRFLLSDPPTSAELRRLQDYVRRTLKDAKAPTLGSGEHLIGTGGTLRNLAKIDRVRRDSPIHRLHGYALGRRELSDIVQRLASQTAAQRLKTPGLNISRFDSILGGAACAQVILESVGAQALTVSGQGLREGIALTMLAEGLPPTHDVRRAAVDALAARFASWDRRLAEQRVLATATVLAALDPQLNGELREVLLYASRLLDIGRSVDFYNRHQHTTDIVLASDLSGFSHRAIASMAAIVRLADKDGASLKPFAPLLGNADQAVLTRAGAILNLGDAIARQSPPDADPTVVGVRERSGLVLSAPWLHPWPLQSAARRVQQVFAVQVRVESSGQIAQDARS